MTHGPTPLPRPTRRRALWLLAVLTAITCFWRLGDAPVYIDDEAREGVYARAMLRTGDYVLPFVPYHLENNLPVPDKPPLFHWIAIAGTQIKAFIAHGRLPTHLEADAAFSDWLLRLPSALTAGLLIIGVAVLGGRLIGERAALIAALTLVTSWQIVHQARFGRVDMVFAAFLGLALILAGRAVIEDDRGALLWAGVCAGLSTLGKGPLALVLLALAIVPFALVTMRQRRAVRPTLSLPWVWSGLIALAIALPWYVLAYQRSGAMLLQSQVVAEQIQQFLGSEATSPTTYLTGYFYVAPVWSIVTLLALLVALRLWRRGEAVPPGIVFCAIWLISFLVLFQIAQFRRRHYLLPAMPAMALLAGWYLDAKLPRTLSRGPREIFLAIGAAWLAAAAIAGWVAQWLVYRALPRWIGAADVAPSDVVLGQLGVAICAAALVVLLRAALQRDRWLVFSACAVFLAAGYVLVFPSGETIGASIASPVPVVRSIETGLPEGKTVTICGVRNDLTLLFQYPARTPERVLVEQPSEASARTAPVERPPGWYLFTAKEWERTQRADASGDGEWQVKAHLAFHDRDDVVPLTLAERRNPPATQP